jgi:hypothetical protein
MALLGSRGTSRRLTVARTRRSTVCASCRTSCRVTSTTPRPAGDRNMSIRRASSAPSGARRPSGCAQAAMTAGMREGDGCAGIMRWRVRHRMLRALERQYSVGTGDRVRRVCVRGLKVIRQSLERAVPMCTSFWGEVYASNERVGYHWDGWEHARRYRIFFLVSQIDELTAESRLPYAIPDPVPHLPFPIGIPIGITKAASSRRPLHPFTPGPPAPPSYRLGASTRS